MLELNFDPFPVIETKRLILRRIVLDDLDSYFALRTNVNAMKHICQVLPTRDETQTKILRINEMISMNDGMAWAICLKPSDTMIGTASFHKVIKEHYRAEIGYMLHPDFWKQGIISEALETVIHYGFYSMRLHSIEAHIDPANLASEKVLEKFKFVKEAYFKENYFFDGKFLDTAVYSLIRPSK
ncbi:MAG: acetyltransferase, ribosomal protein N-acetylase [Bacteroidota bacterium]|jgi:ribosomal-protein-alanine N-acetyltransferase|nr:acetyltransferase, ribosomal protein N-acetylase [Bacteroidota bacterium]